MAANSNSYSDPKWWKEATVYQIYPASFKSSGSGSCPGWGDVRGITSKLDYLKDLGVDIVWVSPIYKSPQVDMGYDIADYTDIDPRYGTLQDVDDLIAGLKARDMKLMMDLVVNHTSDQHAWFKDSRSSKQASKRDWYIWQPAKYDADGNRQPPNNWHQILGEANSAWTWDEHTQEYFLALFTPEQPDLNWRNPAVREAVHDILRFWLDRGASGFRMDVINLISKTPGFPDAPIKHENTRYQPGDKHYANGPELHNYLHEMNEKVLSRYDTITVGEMPFILSEDEILRAVHADAKELNMIFIFELVDIDNAQIRMSVKPFQGADIRRIVSRWQKTMQERNGWNSVFCENHDNPRSVTRYTDDSDKYRNVSSKLLCMMLTTLGGTLYIYQGQELGMRNLPSTTPPDDYEDIESLNYWKRANDEHPGDEKELENAKWVMHRKARDHARTPVQWSAEPNAGFCPDGIEPWMRLNDDYTTINAAAQEEDENSVLQYWRKALYNRKKHKDVFIYGHFELLDEEHDSVFAYKRTSAGDNEAFMTVLNFSGKEVQWELPDHISVQTWAQSNYGDDDGNKAKSGTIALRPWEGLLATCKM